MSDENLISQSDADAIKDRKNHITSLDVDLGAPRRKGILPPLLDRNAGLREWRAWLTLAFNPPAGYRFDGFVRHGRKNVSSATLAFTAPAGNKVEYYIDEQKDLQVTSRLRASVVSITSGLCRMPHLSGPEASDVWVALCSIAHVADEYDDRQETSDWLDSFLAIAEQVTNHTLEEPGRYDALALLYERGRFERRHAKAVAEQQDERAWSRVPVLLVDKQTHRQHARVGELATYIRHVIGVSLGHGTLDSRITALGGERLFLESRNGHAHPHVGLYRLPDPDAEK